MTDVVATVSECAATSDTLSAYARVLLLHMDREVNDQLINLFFS